MTAYSPRQVRVFALLGPVAELVDAMISKIITYPKYTSSTLVRPTTKKQPEKDCFLLLTQSIRARLAVA